MEIRRSAGILLPVYALPSAYGIGSLGREARTFVKFLRDAGQTWWQVLPVGPVGAGNSPYSSESTFAGNPLLIDLELLAEDGLLTKADLFACGLSGGAGSREKRQALLRKLGLPAHLSPNAMLPVLSALYDRQTLLEEMRKL